MKAERKVLSCSHKVFVGLKRVKYQLSAFQLREEHDMNNNFEDDVGVPSTMYHFNISKISIEIRWPSYSRYIFTKLVMITAALETDQVASQ